MNRHWLLLLFIFFVVTYGDALAQMPVNLAIFVDEDSLTLYVSDSGLVSLQGLTFRVDDGSGPKTYSLESYPSFRGLPYDSVPAPICFRLLRDTSNRVAPQDCQNKTLLIQKLAAADVFWYDATTNISHLITIVQGETSQGICPSGNPRCDVIFTPPTRSPNLPANTATVPFTSTRMPEITPTPTLAPALEIAQQGVSSNVDWVPYSPYTQVIRGMEMVLVPAGSFTMGSTQEQIDDAFQECQANRDAAQCERTEFEAEGPQTPIIFTESFWISRHEVTNNQYRKCEGAGVCAPPSERTYYDDPFYDNHPVVYVTWFQANDYATWAGMRLPTEAEWEYAARGPDGLIYPWGNTFDGKLLNFCDTNCGYSWRDEDFDDGYETTAPVGTYLDGASWVGALDMSGNVWEWMSSLYLEYPYDASRENVSGTNDNRKRVLGGGSWTTIPDFLRTANRYGDLSNFSYKNIGFRCVLS